MSSWVTCPTFENTASFAVPVASSNESPHGIQPVDVAKNNILLRPLQILQGHFPGKPKYITRTMDSLEEQGQAMILPAASISSIIRPIIKEVINMMEFEDKKVLVTGSSRGIGEAIARSFAEQGAIVALHYHTNQDRAEKVAASLPGDGHLVVRADIADPAAVQAMVDQVVERMGRIDILVNNAGIYEDHPLSEVSYEEWQGSWRAVIDTNLIGAANASYCAARHMIRQGGGRIVNVSSRGAFRGEPTGPAYGASKAALNAMSQSLAKHLAPYNISVGVVAPGFVETEMARDALTGERGEETRRQSPFNRVARPEEVAYAVLFLASDGAEFMSGAIIDVNGASYLRT